MHVCDLQNCVDGAGRSKARAKPAAAGNGGIQFTISEGGVLRRAPKQQQQSGGGHGPPVVGALLLGMLAERAPDRR